jgi:hypothetical protein
MAKEAAQGGKRPRVRGGFQAVGYALGKKAAKIGRLQRGKIGQAGGAAEMVLQKDKKRREVAPVIAQSVVRRTPFVGKARVPRGDRALYVVVGGET